MMASIFVLNTNTIDRKLSLLWFNYFMGLIIALTTLSREYNKIVICFMFLVGPTHRQLKTKHASNWHSKMNLNTIRSSITQQRMKYQYQIEPA